MNEALEHVLQHCSLHTLLMLLTPVLTRSGFGDIEVLDRRSGRQKSRFGGHELLCRTRLGILPQRVIVKVLADSIRLRHLDELAGAIDRTRADLGIVISPFTLSGKAKKYRDMYYKSRVEVFDGPVFADLLARTGIGVEGGVIDYSHFERLEALSPRVLAFIEENRQ